MEVRISTFGKMLEKKLFPDNSFINLSVNRNEPNVKECSIPQSEGSSEPVIGAVNSGYYDPTNNLSNATKLTPILRINDEKTYQNIIMRPPNPFLFETLQEVELSYSKATEIASEETENMQTGIANYILTQWTPTVAGNILATTGFNQAGTEQKRSAAGTTGSVSGYAGLVSRFAYNDLMVLSSAIKKQNIKRGKWYAMPTVELWEDIKRIPEVVDFEKTGRETMLAKGFVGTWGGITFLDPRQNDRWQANVLYDITVPAAPVVVAYGGALNANCVSALICWNDKYVERNIGELKFFSQKDSPEYMGDLTNWGQRVGATSRRLDEKGVIAMYENPTT